MRLLEYLLFRPGPAGPLFDQWAAVLFGAYVGVALGLLIMGYVAQQFAARHGLRTRIIRKIVWWGILLQLSGVVLLGLRFFNWPFVSARLWLYVQLVLELVAAGYLFWWLRSRYPSLLAQFQWEERKRAYVPKASGGNFESPRRRAVTGRRR